MRISNVNLSAVVAGVFAWLAWFAKGRQTFKGE